MKTLILMRHAKSDWSKPGQGDKERILTERGRLTAGLMAIWLREIDCLPEVALVSSAHRTRETWERMGLQAQVTFDEALYLAEAEVYLSAIRNAPACQRLMILGHNPGIETAMGMMADGRRVNAPTAAIAVFHLPVDEWQDAKFGMAKRLAFETPKSLV